MRLMVRVLAALCGLLAGLGVAAAQVGKRVALVIGNAKYEHIAGLPNVVNDAKAMAALFRAAKFDSVVALHDQRVDAMRRELLAFAERSAEADVAVLFYAGHGIEVDRVNYLIPVDARLKTDLAVEDEAVSLDRVLKLMEPARKLRVVILDACRENPFGTTMKITLPTRSVTRGLGRVEAGAGNTLIAFATEPNAVAEDGSGLNSPFTAALVKHLATPGLDLRIALGNVRDEVMASTGQKQRPYVTSSLGGGVIAIVPAKGSDPAGLTPGQPPPVVLPPQGLSALEKAWAAAEASRSIAMLEWFRAEYATQSPAYASRAEALIAALKKQKQALAAPPPKVSERVVPLTAAEHYVLAERADKDSDPQAAAEHLLAAARAGYKIARSDLADDFVVPEDLSIERCMSDVFVKYRCDPMRKWSTGTQQRLQSLLAASGDYRGPINKVFSKDGVWDAASKAAASAYYSRKE